MSAMGGQRTLGIAPVHHGPEMAPPDRWNRLVCSIVGGLSSDQWREALTVADNPRSREFGFLPCPRRVNAATLVDYLIRNGEEVRWHS